MLIFNTPKFLYQFSIISLLLMPISWAYMALYLINYRLRARKSLQNNKFSGSVICVGNIVLGGSGKTEICLAIGRFLAKQGITYCYLTKGYGRRGRQDIFLPKNSQFDAEICGDEACLLAKDADTAVYNDMQSFILSEIASKYRVIITDDGLHNPSFHKDIKICTFDAKKLDGNGFFVPSGALRAPFMLFKNKIDYLIFTNQVNINSEKCNKIKEKLGLKRYFTSKIEYQIPDLQKKYIAFSGLGINQKFFESLEAVGVQVQRKVEFPDHYKYTDADLENMLKMLTKYNADQLITTSKDFVKISAKYHKHLQILEIMHTLEQDLLESFVKKINL